MKVQDFNPFPHTSPASVQRIPRSRPSRISACMLATVIAIGLPLLQIAPVAADEYRNPQVVATPAPVATYPHRARPHKAHLRHPHRAVNPDDTTPSSDADWTAVNPPDATATTTSDADAYTSAGTAAQAPPPTGSRRTESHIRLTPTSARSATMRTSREKTANDPRL